MADGFVAHGNAAECVARVMEYRAAGVDLPIVFPVPAAGDWGYEQTITAIGGAVNALAPMTKEALPSTPNS